MDHGVSTERLGDGIDWNIAEYWERLFDLDSGYWKEEIQGEYEALECDLLIIDCVEIHPKPRGRGIGPSAIDRTIDIFGAGCGLVACKPWQLQFTHAFACDRKALKRLKAPSVGRDEAVRKLRAYWSRLGFWPLGETGIYLLGMGQRGSTIHREYEPMLLNERFGLLAKAKKKIPLQTQTIHHQAAFISASFPSRRALMSRIGGWPK